MHLNYTTTRGDEERATQTTFFFLQQSAPGISLFSFQ